MNKLFSCKKRMINSAMGGALVIMITIAEKNDFAEFY